MLVLAVSSIPNLTAPEIPEIGLDKIAHLGEYAVMAWLLLRSFRAAGRRHPYRSGLALTLLIAVLDEWHQAWIPGRQPDPLDLAADAVGAVTILAVLYRRERCSAMSGTKAT